MTAERDNNNAIEHAIAEWESINAGPAHGVLVRAAKEALAARRVQASDAARVRAVVCDAVRSEFTHKYDNDEIVNADWIEIQEAIADRVVTLLLGATP